MEKEKKKILIADPDSHVFELLKKDKSASLYIFETAKSGFECLSKIDSFKPDLIFMELLLPQIHGMEILRKIKSDPRTKDVGVILTTAPMMIQNYQAAIDLKCSFFLEKPYSSETVFSLFHRFFDEELKPDPYSGKLSTVKGDHCYLPRAHSPNSYIKFWGTRGSNPVSGPDYIRFGGNTCCLEIRDGDDMIIVDAGTGIRPLGTTFEKDCPKNIHILISHTHWDHLAGFPFFDPIYNPDCHVTVWTPIGFEKTTRDLFTEMLSHAYFPVRLDDVKAKLTFKDIHTGDPIQIGKFTVDTHYSFHPGATLCFKFKIHKKTFGYATDNEFLLGYHGDPKLIGKNHPLLTPYNSFIKFFTGCDFLIHEAQYTPVEYLKKVGWGHSSITNATALILHTEMREWILTHHDPKHTDLDLLKKMQMQYDLFDDMNYACRPRMAFDGMTIPL